MPNLFDDADFACLRADRTAEYTLRQLHIPRGNPESVVLICRYAGESNEAFTKARASAAFKKATPEEREVLWREAVGDHVVVGWKHVLRKDGTPHAYSPAGLVEILSRLQGDGNGDAERADMVNGFTVFVATPDYFTAPLVDAGDLGNG